MIKRAYKTFLHGLALVAPLLITCYIIYWLVVTLESIFGEVLRLFFPPQYYLPGLGLAIAVVLIFLVGFMFRMWLVKKIWSWIEHLFDYIPLVKSIYGSVKDLTNFLNRSAEQQAQKVVLVTMPGSSIKLVGFVTREDFSNLPDRLGTEQTIAVYLPMSYQLGGFTVMLPQKNVEPVDMDIETAMRYVLTGGMTQ